MGKDVVLVGLLDTILPRGVIESYSSKVKGYVKRLFSIKSKNALNAIEQENSDSRQLYDADLINRRGELLWQSIIDWDKKLNRYDGDVVIFQAQDLSALGSVTLEKGLGWKEVLTTPFKVVYVPGSHANLLDADNEGRVAKEIKAIVSTE